MVVLLFVVMRGFGGLVGLVGLVGLTPGAHACENFHKNW